METFSESITKLQNENEKLRLMYCELSEKINNIQMKYEEVLSKKNEHYYQKFLEKKLSATHCKTRFGITDITTHKEHIEIKNWSDFKFAIGQIISYNHDDQKRMCIYFFGEASISRKEEVRELCLKNNISIKELVDTQNGIVIRDVLDVHNNNNEVVLTKMERFRIWLNEHIEYKEDGILKLHEVLKLYFGKIKIHSSVSSKYKIEIEKYLKQKYDDIKWEYGVVTLFDTQYRGWRNLQLKIN